MADVGPPGSLFPLVKVISLGTAMCTTSIKLMTCDATWRQSQGQKNKPNSFHNDLTTLILGLLQGSAAVRAMWTLLSTFMFTVLKSLFPPACFTTLNPTATPNCWYSGSSCLQSPSVGTIDLHLWQLAQPPEMLLVHHILVLQNH
jgi:hypothetical protein